MQVLARWLAVVVILDVAMCEPFESIEESEETTLPATTKRPHISLWKPKKNYGLDECFGRFAYCRESKICDSGQMCVHRSGYCCSPWSKNSQLVSACPAPMLMNVTCRATAPVTWCREDKHCHSAPVRMCCPTLCGYNICI
ncbi:unnamed protein product, partial [Mesorhabditis spiculigera]